MKLFIVTLILLYLFDGILLASQIGSEIEYKKQIINRHKDLLLKFSQSPLVLSSLLKANKNNRGIVSIIKSDASWQLNRELQKSVMSNPLSIEVIKHINNPKLKISEMMVLDKNGVVIAVFPKPTDYWQGDEDKFQRTIISNGEYVGPTQWDTSASTYQFFYSIIIKDPNQNEKVVGVLATGFDVTSEHLNYKLSDK